MTKASRARTRAVRQRMVESGSRYARAVREVGDAPTRDSTDVVRVHIQALLLDQAEYARARHTQIRALESEGHRIVSGGQIGQDSWEILDWRTGQAIARGDNGLDGYDEAADSLDPDEMWVHTDHIGPEIDPLPITAGIPESLCSALADWVFSLSTSDEEIAQFIGWSEAKVHSHRQE
jgi:hypothetical protein